MMKNNEHRRSATDVLNAVNALRNMRDRLKRFPIQRFQPRGRYEFILSDPVTGDVHRRHVENTIVDEGKNKLLRFIGDLTDTETITFSGDGSTTDFSIPAKNVPVHSITDVRVGGSDQTILTDYAYDTDAETIKFSSAPASGTDNVEVDVTYFVHPFRYLAVGTDSTSVTAGDTSLGSESARTDQATAFTHDSGNVEVTGEWNFGTSEANVSIAEAGLFDVPSSASVTGVMLNRTTVSPTIDKSSSFDLTVKWTLSM